MKKTILSLLFVSLLYIISANAMVTNSCTLYEYFPTGGTANAGYCDNVTIVTDVGAEAICDEAGTYINKANANDAQILFNYNITDANNGVFTDNISICWTSNISTLGENNNYLWRISLDGIGQSPIKYLIGNVGGQFVIGIPQFTADCLGTGGNVTTADGTEQSYCLDFNENNSLTFRVNGTQKGFTDDMQCGGTTGASNHNKTMQFIQGHYAGDAHTQDTGTWNVTITNMSCIPAPPPPSPDAFTLTAKDIYDGTGVTSFNITIENSTTSNFYNTTNGTLTLLNQSNGLFNITFHSSYNDSFFERKYTDYNVSANLEGEIYRAIINLYVNDSLTGTGVSSFTVTTNYTSIDVSGSYILLYSKPGSNHVLNISSTQYPIQTNTYSINALDNISFTTNLSPSFNFYLRREADNSIFDINGTNTTRLTIYCPNKNIVIYFKNESSGDSPSAKVSTQENSTVDCDYNLMKLDITYPSSTYFRTLIPKKSQQNVTFWMLDLTKDTGVQKILELVDLTGEWSSGSLRLTTGIDDQNENIIEEYFDVSTSAILYLLKDGLYTIILINNDGTQERQIGTLIADTAGTITLTYPNIPFYPSNTILEDNISWSYTCPFQQCPPPYNTSDMILRLIYLDNTGNTTALTWKIYNGTNTSLLLQTFTSTSSDVTITYQPVNFNQTYYATLLVEHLLLDFNISESSTFGTIEGIAPIIGWTEEEESNIKLYISGIALTIWGMLFSTKHAGIGMASTFVWAIVLRRMGYFPISYIALSLIGFAAIVGFIYEAMKKD